jgi:hypothetical protein
MPEKPSFLARLFRFLGSDLTGRTWEEEGHHPYFGEMTRFCQRDHKNDYWEAEVVPPGETNPIGVTMSGNPSGPEESEVLFCQNAVGDLDALFELGRAAFAEKFVSWTKTPMPENWRGAFQLDGFSIPKDGDARNNWEVCYSVKAAGHYFTAEFEGGRVARVCVDG